MSDHLTPEQLAAIHDKAPVDVRLLGHLDKCEICRTQLERTGQVIEELRQLPPQTPPEDEWPRLAARLEARDKEPAAAVRSVVSRWTTSRALQMAAMFVIALGGGLILGGRLGESRPSESASVVEPLTTGLAGIIGSGGEPPPIDEALVTAAAMRTAALDALAMAPGDPAINDFLFAVERARATAAPAVRGQLPPVADSLRPRFDSIVTTTRRALEDARDRRVTSRALAENGLAAGLPADIFAETPRVLGAEVATIQPEMTLYFDGVDTGVLIIRAIDGSPADRLGLRSGDVIVSVDGAAVGNVTELERVLTRDAAEDRILEWVRRGARQSGTLPRTQR